MTEIGILHGGVADHAGALRAAAFLGNERLEVKHGGMEKWFLDNLWKRMYGYSERGLSVRSRVEQFLVIPNQEYEVVDREKQVYFRPAAQ